MSIKHIGALLIGQSPRPDLVDPLHELLPDFEIIQAGALDDLTPEDLPDVSESSYPLGTRMANGQSVLIDESFLASRLQAALVELEAKGVVAAILLCAGTFAKLVGTVPLFKPFDVGLGVLQVLNFRNVGLISPIAAQAEPIRKRWQQAGMQTMFWAADLTQPDASLYDRLTAQIRKKRLQCIVLDYVGYSRESVQLLQSNIAVPVLDLGYLALRTLASSLSK